MIIPIKCFTCGNVLASKYDKYLEYLNSETLTIYNGKISQQGKLVTMKDRKDKLNNFLEKKEGDLEKPIEAIILDTLGLKRYCCRRHFVGHVDVKL